MATLNIYNAHSSKGAGVAYANVAAAEAVIAAFDADEFTTYRAKARDDGKAVIVAYDEDGYELGVI